MEKILVILGPTASGKSDLAVLLAKKFKGEIISADSRQVYKQMDLGSGKITKSEMKNIPHYLLDVASPKRQFSVNRYQKIAQKALKNILKKEKLPIICGGTGFYIDSLIYNTQFPSTKPDLNLRKKLEKLSNTQLFEKLKKIDPQRAESIDPQNPRRIIRAIEISLSLGKIPLIKKESQYNVLKIGIKKDLEEIEERIDKRLEKRLKKGMIKEVEKLRESGLSWKKLESFGLEYRFIAQYLQEKISKEEMKKLIKTKSRQYAKRQLTWWKKDREIKWIKSEKEAEKITKEFLK